MHVRTALKARSPLLTGSGSSTCTTIRATPITSRLHQGTIINPTGIKLLEGMSVTVYGYADGPTYQANQVDVAYSPYSPYYAGNGNPYPDYGSAYGYGYGSGYGSGYGGYPYYGGGSYFGLGINWGWGWGWGWPGYWGSPGYWGWGGYCCGYYGGYRGYYPGRGYYYPYRGYYPRRLLPRTRRYDQRAPARRSCQWRRPRPGERRLPRRRRAATPPLTGLARLEIGKARYHSAPSATRM